jgi:hypothetical protein
MAATPQLAAPQVPLKPQSAAWNAPRAKPGPTLSQLKREKSSPQEPRTRRSTHDTHALRKTCVQNGNSMQVVYYE